jgi:hypothetical protein
VSELVLVLDSVYAIPSHEKLNALNSVGDVTRPPPVGMMLESNANVPVAVEPASGPLVAVTSNSYVMGVPCAGSTSTPAIPNARTNAHKGFFIVVSFQRESILQREVDWPGR